MLRHVSCAVRRTSSTLAFALLSILAATGCAAGTSDGFLNPSPDDNGHGSGQVGGIYQGWGFPTVVPAGVTSSSSSSSSSTSSGGHGASSSSSSSSSGGSVCDSSNDCSTCGNCGLAGMCQPAMSACQADQSCSALMQCLSGCQDQTCADACATQNPGGQQPYMAVMTCVLCDACPVSCGGQAMGACGP